MSTLDPQTRNEMVRRWQTGQSMRGIAADLHVARATVRRVLDRQRQDRQGDAAAADTAATGAAPAGRPGARRASLVDPYVATIRQLLTRYPRLTVRRLLDELRAAGYTGGYSILSERVAQLREPAAAVWVERFETGPGVQAQMDWAVYTIDFTTEGRRRVNLFSYVLGYSRRQYLHFTETQDFETTLRQHVRAFEHLGGVAATCLYDNMKVVVARYDEGEPIYNPRFLAFATHYGFRPLACRVRWPQTKGKVERPFHYAETNLLNGREFRSLEHLNEVTAWWLANVADVRLHRTTGRRPLDLHAEEQPHLIALPEHPYEVAEMVYRVVDAEGFIAWRQNRYSVPWQATRPGQLLPVKITENEVLVYNLQIEEIARHVRLPVTVTHRDSLQPSHRPPRNVERRREVLEARFAELGPRGAPFLAGLLQTQRQGWAQAERVLALLATYRRADVLAALERAVQYGAYSLSSVQRILAVQARPKTSLEQLAEQSGAHLHPLLTDNPAPPRPASAYQQLLFDKPRADDEPRTPETCNGQPRAGEPRANETCFPHHDERPSHDNEPSAPEGLGHDGSPEEAPHRDERPAASGDGS